ncbi:MAG: hypothetical protein GOV15_02675 [Candidatus Diapherotrites archaeon]|nr:hypothetical protein [Candidatus Diapherotrites archaeon]
MTSPFFETMKGDDEPSESKQRKMFKYEAKQLIAVFRLSPTQKQGLVEEFIQNMISGKFDNEKDTANDLLDRLVL